MPSSPSPPYDRRAYFASVAEGIGTEDSDWRFAYFYEWARFEGFADVGGPHFNPLATTLPGGTNPAEPYWNTFYDADGTEYHVMNYAGFNIGVSKTVATLSNGRYSAIIAALRREEIGELRDEVVAQTRTWGTVGFADHIAGGWEPHPEPTPPPVPDDLESLIEDHEALKAYVLQLNADTVSRFDILELAGADYATMQRARDVLRAAGLLKEEK